MVLPNLFLNWHLIISDVVVVSTCYCGYLVPSQRFCELFELLFFLALLDGVNQWHWLLGM